MSRHPYYNRLINSWKWQCLRASYLADHPVCEICAANDRTRPATEVHHRIPVESGITEMRMTQLAYDVENLQALCRDCHHDIHTQEGVKGQRHKTAAVLEGFRKSFLPEKKGGG